MSFRRKSVRRTSRQHRSRRTSGRMTARQSQPHVARKTWWQRFGYSNLAYLLIAPFFSPLGLRAMLGVCSLPAIGNGADEALFGLYFYILGSFLFLIVNAVGVPLALVMHWSVNRRLIGCALPIGMRLLNVGLTHFLMAVSPTLKACLLR